MNYGSSVSRIKRTKKRNAKFVKQSLKTKDISKLEELPTKQKIKPRRGN